MTFLVADRVQETCAAPGTGIVTLLGAVTQYQSFSAGIGANNTTYYTIADQTGSNWEVGLGTIGATGLTLTRTTVLASSNANSIVNFSVGTQNIWCDYPAGKAVYTDASNNISNLAGGISTVNYLQFATAYTPTTPAVGEMWWSSGQAPNVQMTANVVGQLFEDNYIYAKASVAVTFGQLVMFTGAVGASGVVTYAPATSGLSNGLYIMGVAAETVAVNGFGLVQTFGLVKGFDTTGSAYSETWATGDLIYYNNAAGGLTHTYPTSGPVVTVAVVTNAGSGGSGSLLIRPTVTQRITAGTGISVSQTQTGTVVTNSLPMVYPASGIVSSTGSAWNTSYSTTGSGSVLALATSPTFTTPLLGTPTSGVLTTCTGYTYANLSGTVPTWNQNTSGTAAGLSATLAIASGGTNATATPTLGGVIVGTGTAYSTTAAGTAGQAIVSNGASAPTWQDLTLANLPGAWTKKAVDAATTANITLSAPQTIDGIAVIAGNRVLVKNQTLSQNNGIYQVNAGAWTRTTDANTSGNIAGGTVSVDSGTANFGSIWTNTFLPTATLGTTVMPWYRIMDTSQTLTVANGGTGVATLSGVAFGNATSAFTAATGAQISTALGSTAITGNAAGLSATLVATSGGTGQSTYAVGDLLQGAATNTLAKLSAVATGNALISGGVTTASSWGKIGLTTHVSGTLPITNGGTGASTLIGAGIPTLSANNSFTGSNTFSNNTYIQPTTGTQSYFWVTNNNTSTVNFSAASMSCSSTVAAFVSDKQGTGSYLPMVFYTNNNEGVRLDLSSNLLVGYTSSNGAYKLQVNSQIFATSSTIATSDKNYKENITPLIGALSLVNNLNPVQFNWKKHPVHNFDLSNPTVGFIAQEVQQVLNETPYVNSIVKVNETTLPNGTVEPFLGIAEGNLIALLTAAIKEQQSLIKSLTERVAILESK